MLELILASAVTKIVRPRWVMVNIIVLDWVICLRVFIELLESIIFIKKFNDNMINNDKYENV